MQGLQRIRNLIEGERAVVIYKKGVDDWALLTSGCSGL